jgi:hypothetical protein
LPIRQRGFLVLDGPAFAKVPYYSLDPATTNRAAKDSLFKNKQELTIL